jgi:hypothetical protein
LSESTNAEVDFGGNQVAMNSNGFGAGPLALMGTNGVTYAAWQWRGSDSAAVSNADGTITSQVSANPTAGFSVVTWTGNGATSTIGHGLGVAPKFIITKLRNVADGWYSYHADIGNTKFIRLDSTSASTTSTIFGNTSPTSTVFTYQLGVYNAVAYCFAEVEGYSKIGSYIGNGSADGPFVYTGFRPAFIMLKRTNSTGSWYMWDTARGTYNVIGPVIYSNLINAEGNSTFSDILSNGFKLRVAGDTNSNASGSTYIYMAFAENPFKNSLAR